MSHRDMLMELLEGEQREIAIKDFALENLKDDERQQRYEGFKRRAETTQQAIDRNLQQRQKALLKAAALTAALCKFPEGDKDMTINVPIKRLHGDAVIPSQAKASDAGYDLRALENYTLEPQEREMFRTGIAVAIPHGYVGYIKPRSGLAARNGLDVLGGVIDSGYRGELGVILLNTDTTEAINVSKGDRIAQLVIKPVMDVDFEEVHELPPSERGQGGFGHTGA